MKNPTPIYITAAGQISMQQPLCDEWCTSPLSYDEPYVRSVDPDFKQFISPGESRRLGKLLKRALATALHTLRQAGVEQPDAIITGTGLGSVESTEAFLGDLITQGEQMLKPTHFMQSTHNTIGSLIAIHTHTHGYNNTYAHLGLSFESALMDAMLQLRAGRIGNALVGAHDAITPSYFTLLQRSGYVGQPGMVPCGEASVEVMLSATPTADTYCEVCGLRLIHQPTADDLESALHALCDTAGIEATDIRTIVSGQNGDTRHDEAYNRLLPAWCVDDSRRTVRYKQLFSESYTASALGLYAAATLLHRGDVAGPLLLAHIYDGGCDASLILVR